MNSSHSEWIKELIHSLDQSLYDLVFSGHLIYIPRNVPHWSLGPISPQNGRVSTHILTIFNF